MHGDAAIKILLSAEPMMLLMMNELSMAFAEIMFPHLSMSPWQVCTYDNTYSSVRLKRAKFDVQTCPDEKS